MKKDLLEQKSILSLVLSAACVCWMASYVGCASADNEQDLNWKEMISAGLWEQSSAAFAPRYIDQNQENDFWQTFVTPSVEQPCSDLFIEGGEAVKKRDFWYLAVGFPQKNGAGASEMKAPEVSLRFIQDGKKKTVVDSLESKVTQINLSDENRSISYLVEAWFPKNPIRTVECNASLNVETNESEGECICENDVGIRSTCALSGFNASSCCKSDPNGERVFLKTAIRATFCAEACTESVALGRCGS